MSNAWEDSTGLAAYPATVKKLLLEPTLFFEEIDPATPLKRALVFSIVSFSLAGAASILWGLIGGLVQLGLGTNYLGQPIEQQAIILEMVVNIGVGVIYPLLGLAGMFINGGITYLFLLLFGSGKSGYLATVKANMYGTAPLFLAFVPCCGNIVGGIWTLVITIIGLIKLHRSSTGSVIAAVFLPGLICCTCAFLGILVAVAVAGVSMSHIISQIPH